jgi:Smg protein
MKGVSMNENMVQVLIYLYENYLDGNGKPPIDQDELEIELSRAGFANGEISAALGWLDELARRMDTTEYPARTAGSIRVYTDAECAQLTVEARSLLMFLEQSAILDPLSRELVIDRAMAIETNTVSVDELKWIVLLVLMGRPGRESAHSQMEELIYSDAPAQLH